MPPCASVLRGNADSRTRDEGLTTGNATMREFTTTIDIHAPADRVWAVMRDVERWHEWTASISSVEVLTPQPFASGSKARVRQPKLLPAVFEVIGWDPPHSFDWVSRSAGVTAVARHAVQPTAAGARARLSVEFHGVLAPVLAWFAGSLVNKYLQMEAAGLKQRSEDGGGNTAARIGDNHIE